MCENCWQFLPKNRLFTGSLTSQESTSFTPIFLPALTQFIFWDHFQYFHNFISKIENPFFFGARRQFRWYEWPRAVWSTSHTVWMFIRLQGYPFDGSGTSRGVSMVHVLSYVSLPTINFLLYNSSNRTWKCIWSVVSCVAAWASDVEYRNYST